MPKRPFLVLPDRECIPLEGPYRIEELRGEWYVLGNYQVIPCESELAAWERLAVLEIEHDAHALASEALAGLPQTRLQARSSLYRSAPMGPQHQPDYVNAVVQLRTGLEPEALLDQLQGIEREQGRVRAQHWGPRTLDLDILLFGVFASTLRGNICHSTF